MALEKRNEVVETEDENITFEKWDDDNVNLKIKLLRGIYAYGFETPSPIQQKSIIPMITGRDVIAQAQSGTGKTGAFITGVLQIVDEKVNETQAIIVCPTHELAIQNYTVCDEIGSSHLKTKPMLLIGGTSIKEDIESIKESVPQIVIGTPGRIQHMMQKRYLKYDHVKVIVLDEADEMLSYRFEQQIYNIFRCLKDEVQICLYSATMPPELHDMTSKFMIDPVSILVKKGLLTLEGLHQYKVGVNNDHDKYDCLKDLFNKISVSQSIIYCNSNKRVQDLYDAMVQDNFPVVCIHSKMDVHERRNNFKRFKDGEFRVLISSDVTARGIDIQQVSVVVNFDVPKCKHKYLHRIGRSARYGRKGMAINFVSRRDYRKLREITEWYQTEINYLPEDFSKLLR